MNIGLVNIQVLQERRAAPAQRSELPLRMENPHFKQGFEEAQHSTPIELSDGAIIDLFRLFVETGGLPLENEGSADEVAHLSGFICGKLFQLL
ncbi:MAG TPA: hypothetical protein VH593_07670 [Ktedonobacteraceae bacterium]